MTDSASFTKETGNLRETHVDFCPASVFQASDFAFALLFAFATGSEAEALQDALLLLFAYGKDNTCELSPFDHSPTRNFRRLLFRCATLNYFTTAARSFIIFHAGQPSVRWLPNVKWPPSAPTEAAAVDDITYSSPSSVSSDSPCSCPTAASLSCLHSTSVPFP